MAFWTPASPAPDELPLEEPEELPLEDPEELPLDEPDELPLEEPDELPLEEPEELPLEEPLDEPDEEPPSLEPPPEDELSSLLQAVPAIANATHDAVRSPKPMLLFMVSPKESKEEFHAIETLSRFDRVIRRVRASGFTAQTIS